VDRRFQFAVCVLAGAAGLLLALRSAKLHGQEQALAAQAHPSMPRALVIVDPGHGGTDPGADLGNKVAERDVTFALATKLRTALAAEGMNAVLTRDAGASDAVSADQRAATANRGHAVACISLHATRSGSGVHVYTSALPALNDTEDPTLLPARWETAQEHFVTQSVRLAAALKAAFEPAGLPAALGTTTVPPLDSMMCPAVAIEFAPLNTLEASGKGAEDGHYQDSAVRAMVGALVKWRNDISGQVVPIKDTP
jgi:N-acetylmuramoyl-L-alanine amidase